MFDERPAVLVEVRPYDVHGAPHVEVVIAFADGTREAARLGRESVAPGVGPGDAVVVRSVMRTIVEVLPAEGAPGR